MIEHIPIEMIKIENDGFHMIISITLNDKVARLLLDTGASKTVFDEARLGEFMDKGKFTDNDKLSSGLGTDSMQSKIAIISKLGFNKIVLEDYEVAVLDLIHVNQSYQKLEIPPIDGVMGGDLLVALQAVIDYNKKSLVITRE